MVSQVALPFGAFCYYRRVRREMGYISARRFPVDPLFLEEFLIGGNPIRIFLVVSFLGEEISSWWTIPQTFCYWLDVLREKIWVVGKPLRKTEVRAGNIVFSAGYEVPFLSGCS